MRYGSFILTHKQTEWVYAKWCEGYTQEQLADALCVSIKTITRAIHGRPKIRPILKYDFEEEIRERLEKQKGEGA